MPGRGPGAPPPSPAPPPWFWATPRAPGPGPPPEFVFLFAPRIGELRSLVTVFFNFAPFWMDLRRSPLSAPPPLLFNGLNAGPEDLAGPGGGGAGGPGGGGGGIVARNVNHFCLINMGAAVHLLTFELPDNHWKIVTSWNRFRSDLRCHRNVIFVIWNKMFTMFECKPIILTTEFINFPNMATTQTGGSQCQFQCQSALLCSDVSPTDSDVTALSVLWWCLGTHGPPWTTPRPGPAH